MTEEKFMQNQNVINFLKLKGSWGVLGSQNTGSSYPAYATIVSSGSAVFGDNIIAGKGPNKQWWHMPDNWNQYSGYPTHPKSLSTSRS